MLNPTEPHQSLLLITYTLSAFSEGGFLVSLFSFIHEEYGQREWALIAGMMLSAGGLGLAAFNQLVFATLQVFGTKGQEAEDQFGQRSFSYGSFTSYDGWSLWLFLGTFVASLFGFVLAAFGYMYTDLPHKRKVDANIEMVRF